MRTVEVASAMALTEMLESLKTGDVLLYRTNDLGALFNSWMQRSKWSHVGVVVRGDAGLTKALFPQDYAQPCADEDAALCVFEAVPSRGVCLFPLKDRLSRTYKSIKILGVVRHIGPELTSEQQSSLLEFVRLVKGRKLETTSRDMVNALLCGLRKGRHEDWSQFFCSELAAEALQQMGILRDEGLNSNDILPRSFAQSDGPLSTHCNEAHAFDPPEILLDSTQLPLFRELQEHKAELKRRSSKT